MCPPPHVGSYLSNKPSDRPCHRFRAVLKFRLGKLPEISTNCPMTNDFRMEADSMGEMKVPADAYYGAQTARAVENFPISNLRFSRQFIQALGLIKKQAAATNAGLGYVPPKIAQAIQ